MLEVILLGCVPIFMMASKWVDGGLQQSLDNDAGNSSVTIQSMSISNFGTLLAGTTTIAAATQKASSALDSKVRTGNSIDYVATFGTSTGTIVVSNIVLHRVASGSYTVVAAGVDALSITKDNTYSFIPTLRDTRTSV